MGMGKGCSGCSPKCKVSCESKMMCATKPACTKDEIESESNQEPWEFCVGLASNDCKAHIESVAPCMEIHVLKPGMTTSTEIMISRVNILVDKNDVVKRAPWSGR